MTTAVRLHRKRAANPATPKESFDIAAAIRLLRKAVASFPKTALFELSAKGHKSVFEVLVACIISIRTRDETTVPVAEELLAPRQPRMRWRGLLRR
jgi:endonuclease-3